MPFYVDDPVTLASGRIACRAHHAVVCGYCTVDYSFMEEALTEDGVVLPNLEDDEVIDTDDEDEDSSDSGTYDIHIDDDKSDSSGSRKSIDMIIGDPSAGPDRRVGSGKVIPEKFIPPNEGDLPQQLFISKTSYKATPPVRRFIRRGNLAQILIYTDGACLDNGGSDPRAGSAFVFRPRTQFQEQGHALFRLESKGPTGDPYPQTSNRAELRAVIGALRFRSWTGEGFKSLVIATDSEYVVEGSTTWVRNWLRNHWKTRGGTPVKNKDLWECLLGEFERWSDRGLEIKFWRIPRELNTEADRLAKEAAELEESSQFGDVCGVLV